MFESNNVVNNALQWAIHDWLGSTVYYALNYTIGYLDGLEEESVSRDKLNGLDYLLGLRGLYERFDFVLSANSS